MHSRKGKPLSSELSGAVFTPETLSKYSGEADDIIYIAILGRVFDVSSGFSFYGPGKSYHFFAGRDASRAFITGDFSSIESADDVLNMSLSELGQLKDWLKMYENKYAYKGKLIGRFYDENGDPTEYHKKLLIKFEQAESKKQSDNEEKDQFPPCNVEWNPEKGSKVWCSTKSGGVDRSWIGVPRKLYGPGGKSHRCACIDNTAPQTEYVMSETTDHSKYVPGYFEQYEGCDPNSVYCFIKSR